MREERDFAHEETTDDLTEALMKMEEAKRDLVNEVENQRCGMLRRRLNTSPSWKPLDAGGRVELPKRTPG